MIPKGYEPESNNNRDITRAIVAIIKNDPSDELITRFVDRTYRLRNSNITLSSLNSITSFSNRNRFYELSKVSEDPIYQISIAQSFYLLYNSIVDAEKTIHKLSTLCNEFIKNYKKIYNELLSIVWLSEASILRFMSLKDKNSRHELIKSEFNFLLKKLQIELANINKIGDLNSGQIRRLASTYNIIVDQPSRENETKIRSTLKQLGLGSDADILVSDAIRAEEINKLEEFWSIIQLRIDGDITWSEQLEELLN